MRSGVIFVASVLVAAFVVFLLAVTQFSSDPFAWSARHLNYVAAALVPVIPIAILARWTWRRRPRVEYDETDTDVADATDGDDTDTDTDTASVSPEPQSAPTVAALLSRTAPAPASPQPAQSETETETEDEAEAQAPRSKGASATSDRQFQSVEQLAVASVLERGRSVADVARTLKVRPATVEMWVARARE